MNRVNLDNLSEVLCVFLQYHPNKIRRKALEYMSVPEHDPDVEQLLESFGVEVIDELMVEKSTFEELNILKVMASGPDANQYAKWMIIDKLTPLFINVYRKNSSYSLEEHMLVCIEIACQIIDEYDEDFIGALKLRLRDVDGILLSEAKDNMGITVWQYVKKVSKERQEYVNEYGIEPSVDYLSQKTGYSVARVKTYLSILDFKILSIEGITESMNDEMVMELGYIEGTDNVYEKENSQSLMLEEIKKLGDDLAVEIVLSKYKFDGHSLTKKDICKEWNISEKEYNKILSKSLNKLKFLLADFI